MKSLRRGFVLCLLLIAATGCDRVTKHYAVATLAGAPSQSFLSDTVRLDYHENRGGFLSHGSGWSPAVRAGVFQFGNGVFLLATIVIGLRSRWSRVGMVGLTLFVAGGLSNLIDRVALGGVIDFLNIGVGPWRTGIFNIADVAIMAGVALFLIEGYRVKRARPALAIR